MITSGALSFVERRKRGLHSARRITRRDFLASAPGWDPNCSLASILTRDLEYLGQVRPGRLTKRYEGGCALVVSSVCIAAGQDSVPKFCDILKTGRRSIPSRDDVINGIDWATSVRSEGYPIAAILRVVQPSQNCFELVGSFSLSQERARNLCHYRHVDSRTNHQDNDQQCNRSPYNVSSLDKGECFLRGRPS